MAQLTHTEYDLLERAVTRGERIIVRRRGTEYAVIPLSLKVSGGREIIEARNPTTGDPMSLDLADVDSIQAVPR
jgi:hypothetical protein